LGDLVIDYLVPPVMSLVFLTSDGEVYLWKKYKEGRILFISDGVMKFMTIRGKQELNVSLEL
jgi:hypothetical protein